MKKYRVPVVIGGAIRVAEEDAETDVLTVLIPENREAYASKYVGNVVVEAESAVVARDEVFHRLAKGAQDEASTEYKNRWLYILSLVHRDQLKNGLINQMAYKMDEPNKLTRNRHMMKVGQMSNLLTDMIMDGTATDAEFVDAITHSIVMLDAFKYNLDYKQSEKDHHIQELLAKYRRKAKK